MTSSHQSPDAPPPPKSPPPPLKEPPPEKPPPKPPSDHPPAKPPPGEWRPRKIAERARMPMTAATLTRSPSNKHVEGAITNESAPPPATPRPSRCPPRMFLFNDPATT